MTKTLLLSLTVLAFLLAPAVRADEAKDQIKAFMHGNKVYWWFSDKAIQEHSRTTLVLSPQ